MIIRATRANSLSSVLTYQPSNNGLLVVESSNSEVIVKRTKVINSNIFLSSITVSTINSVFSTIVIDSVTLANPKINNIDIYPLNNLSNSTILTVVKDNSTNILYSPINRYNRDITDWKTITIDSVSNVINYDDNYLRFVNTNHTHDFNIYENTNNYSTHSSTSNWHNLTLNQLGLTNILPTTSTPLIVSNNLNEYSSSNIQCKYNLSISPISNYNCGINSGEILQLKQDNKLPVLNGKLLKFPTGLTPSNAYSGRRNLIINGNFEVKQRINVGNIKYRNIINSNSVSCETTNYLSFELNTSFQYTFDCWIAKSTSITGSKITPFAYSYSELLSNGSPSTYACKIEPNTGNTVILGQRFENPNIAKNRKLVLSFYYRSTEEITSRITYNDDTGVEQIITPLNNSNQPDIILSISTSFNRVSFSFNGPTTELQGYFQLNILKTNKNIEITGIQLEYDNLTQLEYLPYDYTWLLCQRYYMIYWSEHNGGSETGYWNSTQINWGVIDTSSYGLLTVPLYINHDKYNNLVLEYNNTSLSDYELITYTNNTIPVTNISIQTKSHSFIVLKLDFGPNDLIRAFSGNWFLFNKKITDPVTTLVFKWEL